MAASLLHGARRLAVEDELRIGRAEDNDVVLGGDQVSRHHARVFLREGDLWLADLGSRHGTKLNGEVLQDEARPLAGGDEIAVGEERIRVLVGGETRMESRPSGVVRTRTVRFEGDRVAVGRDEHNDVVLPDPNVSRFHAELVRQDGAVEVIDLGSRNGTRVDGEQVERARVEPGSEVGIGPFGLRVEGDEVVAVDEHGELRLDASSLAMRVREKQILAPTDISIEPGQFVAFIGESGAGKTTLLKALAGVTHPSAGRITINGEPLAARQTDIGYVPQDDIVHRFLTVREALTFAARLRLPQDADEAEIRVAVDRVLAELSLEEHEDTQVGSLSGGQRKRTGVAAELLNRPSLLFLDEPTTGLDPGLETQTMRLLRELSARGRAIVVVTHATKNLALCDRVVVMGRGGEMTFDGAPADALTFFEVDDYDGIYGALAGRPPGDWRRRFDHWREGRPAPTRAPEADGRATAPAARRSQGLRLLPQTAVLIRRYVKLFLRDRRNLALLLGQAPLLALFNVALFESGVFERAAPNASDAVQLLFLLTITVIWLGSIDAAPEIVKERSVAEREAAVGVRFSAYLASKLAVLFSLVTLQVLLYVGVTLLFRPLDAPAGDYLGVFALLVATGFAAVGMGLLVSAAVTSQEQAMSLIPLAVIPQLLFAGTIVPLARMAEPAHTLAYAIFSQWGLAAVGTDVDMNGRLEEDPAFARVNRFGEDFFDVGLAAGLLVQAGFLAVFLTGVTLLVRRASS